MDSFKEMGWIKFFSYYIIALKFTFGTVDNDLLLLLDGLALRRGRVLLVGDHLSQEVDVTVNKALKFVIKYFHHKKGSSRKQRLEYTDRS
jgi:hypothetical protein